MGRLRERLWIEEISGRGMGRNGTAPAWTINAEWKVAHRRNSLRDDPSFAKSWFLSGFGWFPSFPILDSLLMFHCVYIIIRHGTLRLIPADHLTICDLRIPFLS